MLLFYDNNSWWLSETWCSDRLSIQNKLVWRSRFNELSKYTKKIEFIKP